MLFRFTKQQLVLLSVLCLLLACLVFVPQVAFADIVDGMLRIVSANTSAVWIYFIIKSLLVCNDYLSILNFGQF